MIQKLILGTVQLGIDYGINNQRGRPSKIDSFEILNYAYQSGVRILDTAEAYGVAHDIIGKFHKKYNKRFKIITKDKFSDGINEDLENRLLNYCSLLSIDYLYGYMFHNYESLKGNNNYYLQLLELRKKGIVQKIGISLYNNNELLDVIENYNNFDFIQMPFNLLDNAMKRKEVFKKASLNNIKVFVRSVFLQGLFFMETNKISKQFSTLKPYLESLNDLKKEFDIDTASIALKYVVEKDYINQVLIGVDSVDQLKLNLSILNNHHKIPHEKIDIIDVKDDKLLNPVNWTNS